MNVSGLAAVSGFVHGSPVLNYSHDYVNVHEDGGRIPPRNHGAAGPTPRAGNNPLSAPRLPERSPELLRQWSI